MKLYLSSYRVPTPEDLFDLIGKRPADTKVALIPNAKDAYIERIRDLKTNEAVDFFSGMGVADVDIVDLRNYSDAKVLKRTLVDYDLIWVNGGNTFMLRYEMQRSGFGEIVEDLLNEGVVYGGESAGQLVAGPTLKGSEVADNKEFALEIIWDGLGLIQEMIWPHADENKYADALLNMQSLYPDLIELKNSQAYVVKGDTAKVVERS